MFCLGNRKIKVSLLVGVLWDENNCFSQCRRTLCWQGECDWVNVFILFTQEPKRSLQEISISSIFSLLTSLQKQASLEVKFAILIFPTLHHTHIHHFWVFFAALFPEGFCKTSILTPQCGWYIGIRSDREGRDGWGKFRPYKNNLETKLWNFSQTETRQWLPAVIRGSKEWAETRAQAVPQVVQPYARRNTVDAKSLKSLRGVFDADSSEMQWTRKARKEIRREGANYKILES